jgi:hypothetical protein
MPSFSSKFFYEKSTRHASFNFNQEARSLYINQPRFPFEYYVNISLSNIGTAKEFVSDFFGSADLDQIMPLVKTVDMPAMKIETTPLNQYNRKRLSQTKIAFEPVKMVFHDVADGKTLKFWEMYYRYYFADGSEPGKNQNKTPESSGSVYSTESSATQRNNTTQISSSPPSSTNMNGDKSTIQNIVQDTLDNHNFGFNLPVVKNVRNLIQTIDIYQVHGGRFNQVTLVNPRVSAFTHDVLSYASSDKTLEISFTFEYEYAYYTMQNMKIGGDETNNTSTIDQFGHGDFLELTNLAFNSADPDFIETNSQSVQTSDYLSSVGNNVQADLSSITDEANNAGNEARTSASSLSGMVDLGSAPNSNTVTTVTSSRSFGFSPENKSSDMYLDMNREVGQGEQNGG